MFALINADNIIIQVQPHPGDGFVEVDASALPGQMRDPSTGQLSSPPPSAAEVDAHRAVKQSEIRDKADALLKSVGAEYGDIERATWDQQYAEAQAVQADAGAEAPLLSAIATARRMDVAELAQRIIANRAAWVPISGHVVGQRLVLQDRLDAASTVAEIEAIEVAYDLPAA